MNCLKRYYVLILAAILLILAVMFISFDEISAIEKIINKQEFKQISFRCVVYFIFGLGEIIKYTGIILLMPGLCFLGIFKSGVALLGLVAGSIFWVLAVLAILFTSWEIKFYFPFKKRKTVLPAEEKKDGSSSGKKSFFKAHLRKTGIFCRQRIGKLFRSCVGLLVYACLMYTGGKFILVVLYFCL